MTRSMCLIFFGIFIFGFTSSGRDCCLTRTFQVDDNLYDVYTSELQLLSRHLQPGIRPDVRRQNLTGLIRRLNDETLTEIKDYGLLLNPAKSKTDFITQAEAQEILSSIESHPVVGSEQYSKYDPNMEVGFCFGRATYVQMELERRGLKKESVSKLFAISKLNYKGTPWTFHVATLAKGPGSSWWVIDNVVGRVLTPEQWMREVEKFDLVPKLPLVRFYFTDAAKFQPHMGEFDPKDLTFASFNNYFKDLNEWFSKSK
jgi:hypothetical protein